MLFYATLFLMAVAVYTVLSVLLGFPAYMIFQGPRIIEHRDGRCRVKWKYDKWLHTDGKLWSMANHSDNYFRSLEEAEAAVKAYVKKIDKDAVVATHRITFRNR